MFNLNIITPFAHAPRTLWMVWVFTTGYLGACQTTSPSGGARNTLYLLCRIHHHYHVLFPTPYPVLVVIRTLTRTHPPAPVRMRPHVSM